LALAPPSAAVYRDCSSLRRFEPRLQLLRGFWSLSTSARPLLARRPRPEGKERLALRCFCAAEGPGDGCWVRPRSRPAPIPHVAEPYRATNTSCAPEAGPHALVCGTAELCFCTLLQNHRCGQLRHCPPVPADVRD
ncbi:hypothetical protein H1C71_000191, partial [Ictidomys tridecemlineatus]